MLRKSLAATFTSLFITVITGTAFASPPASVRVAAGEEPAKLAEVLTILHAVGRWSVDISALADKRAKSSSVKDYAREISTTNPEKDAKLVDIAKKHGIDLGPLDPQTEEGKSLLDRMKAETALLGSLEGDAFDKEYMTLVTNTQQSVIHFLEASKTAAKDPDTKQFMDNMLSTVQSRVKTAQDIMAKVYGNRI
jgi:predicted outer membrane protein